MITRILCLVSLMFAVSAAQGIGRAITTQTITFEATVEDSGTFLGATCESKNDNCAAYKKKLCEFIREPLIPLNPPSDFCRVEILDNRKENKMDVKVTLTLLNDTVASGLFYDVRYSTFGAVLNQSLVYLHNTPKARVTITKFEPPLSGNARTPETVVLKVSGQLQSTEKPAGAGGEYTEKQKCEYEKRLFNQDLGRDLLNVIYKYSPKNKSSLFTLTKTGGFEFQISYPKTFFTDTKIDYERGFYGKIKWGFQNPTSEKIFYKKETINVELVQTPPSTGGAPVAPESIYKIPETIPFEFTAFVNDDGKLKGKKCGGPKEECTEYKQQLCQLAQKPLLCGRVPTSWKSCSVDVLSEKQTDKPLQAKITLRIQEAPANMYPITYAPLDSCPTFAGLYKLAFASHSANTTLDITEFIPPLKPVGITTEGVDIQIRGTLLSKGNPVESAYWNKGAEEKVKAQLLALALQDEMLNTFYHLSSRKLKALTFNTTSTFVTATLTISYPKTVFEENAIDPGCDLNGMLQWGIRSVKTTKGYSFSAEDTVVQNSAAIERSTSFTFRATVTDTGKFQGAECSGVSGECVKYKEKLCAFVRKAFISSEIVSRDDCLIQILSNRTAENKLDVRISLQLNMHASTLQFDVNCPTFGGALKEAFNLLYNTPEVKLNITEIETLQLPPTTTQPSSTKPAVYLVTGSLYRNGQPVVDSTATPKIDECEVNKQLATLDMGEDLLNVMYMYNRDNITFERIAPVIKQGQKSIQVSFKLYYKKNFFDTTTMDPDCDFADKLQWGFRHSVLKDQFHMGEDTIVQRKEDADPNTGPATVTAVEYTATVTDGGKLNGIECDPKTESCTAYKLQLCQLMEEPLLCNRVPNQPNACTIKIIERSKDAKSLKANISLGVLDGYDIPNIPPITYQDGCNTFSALHNLAFKTFYDSPIVDLGIEPLPKEKADKLKDPVEFTVTGLLKNKKDETVKTVPDLFEFNYQLANLKMPGKLLQAVYKYNKERTFTPVQLGQGNTIAGDVEFKVGFSKAFLVDNGIDPTCDLVEMLKWGFEYSEDVYHLSGARVVLAQGP